MDHKDRQAIERLINAVVDLAVLANFEKDAFLETLERRFDAACDTFTKPTAPATPPATPAPVNETHWEQQRRIRKDVLAVLQQNAGSGGTAVMEIVEHFNLGYYQSARNLLDSLVASGEARRTRQNGRGVRYFPA